MGNLTISIFGNQIFSKIINELKLFSKYKKLINKEERKNIFFEGRLAQYKYLNMDEAIERALILFDKIKKLKK